MGQYSNDPLTDARIKLSHDKWVTNDDEWQRYAAREEDEEEPTEGIKENLEGIPSMDLEEAAEDFVWEVMENDEDGISELARKLRPSSKIDDYYDALEEFFKAGARWMAEQGVSYTDKIYNWSDDDKLDGVDENKFTLDGFGEEEALSRGVKQGLFKVQDKVIVQIRKAE